MGGEFRREQLVGLLKLVREAGELVEDPEGRQKHVLVGLADLLAAPLAASVVDTDFHPGGRGNMMLLHEHGWRDDSDKKRVVEMHIERGASVHPVVAASMVRPEARRPGGVLTVRRRDLVEDRVWDASIFVQECMRPARAGDALLVLRGTDTPKEIRGLAFHKGWGDRPFSVEDRNLLDLFMEACSGLLGDWRPSRDDAIVAALTPRQRDTLDCILAGRSEKEIAAALGLSPHTVHVHAKAIYRRFGVRSRAELMSRFVRRRRSSA